MALRLTCPKREATRALVVVGGTRTTSCGIRARSGTTGRRATHRARSAAVLAGGSTLRTSTTRCRRRARAPLGRSRRRRGRRRRKTGGLARRTRMQRRMRWVRQRGGGRRRGGRMSRRWTRIRTGATRRRNSRKTPRAACMGTIVQLWAQQAMNGMGHGGRPRKRSSTMSSRSLAWARMDGEARSGRGYGWAGADARGRDGRIVVDYIPDLAMTSFTTPAVRCAEDTHVYVPLSARPGILFSHTCYGGSWYVLSSAVRFSPMFFSRSVSETVDRGSLSASRLHPERLDVDKRREMVVH